MIADRCDTVQLCSHWICIVAHHSPLLDHIRAAAARDAAMEHSAAAPAQLQVNAYNGEEEGCMR